MTRPLTQAEKRRIRKRLRDDFPHYAKRCLRIRTKAGSVEPLELNDAQHHVHTLIEEQKERTGKVRALILKGRQQGASTYVEGRYYWLTTHRFGCRAFILTHHADATANLFGMAERYHENCPQVVKPATGASNSRELHFERLDSGYKVGTAGSKAVGRSDTIQLFHGSEVAFWPNQREHLAGIMQAVPDEPGTEIILESTSDGPSGVFFEMYQDAMEGRSDYIPIFVPWYWQSEYTRDATGFEPTEEEAAYGERHGLTIEQIAWRRNKIIELGDSELFTREYPSTPDEAFAANRRGAVYPQLAADFWNSEWVIDYDPKKWRDLKTILTVDPGYVRSAWTWWAEIDTCEWVAFDELGPQRMSDRDCVAEVNRRGWPIDEIWVDPAAKNKQSAVDLSTVQMLKGIKTRSQTPIRYISGVFRDIEWGVTKMRYMLGDPRKKIPIRLFFASRLRSIERKMSHALVKSLLSYRYPDEKEDSPTPSQPLKDGFNDHFADATRYFAVGMFLTSPLRRIDPTIDQVAHGQSGYKQA